MSHLACAEEADNPMNRRQLEHFLSDVRRLGLTGKPLSIAASSGIFLGPDFQLSLGPPGGGYVWHRAAQQSAEPDAPSH